MSPAGNGSQQMLTFVLGAENYGVDILRVQEIRGWSNVTRLPYAAPHVLGVLNLRGSIVPIVDLRLRFALEHADYSALTVIIVVSVEAGGSRRDVGVVVDGVSDVIDVAAADVRPTPDIGNRGSSGFFTGLTTLGDKMVALVDIDRLMGDDLNGGTVGDDGEVQAAARYHAGSAHGEASLG
jgi:purine-binding chemotaxis protein CheW